MTIEAKRGSQEAIAKARAHSAIIFQSGISPEHQLPFPGAPGYKFNFDTGDFVAIEKLLVQSTVPTAEVLNPTRVDVVANGTC